jgi:O-antigen ligase
MAITLYQLAKFFAYAAVFSVVVVMSTTFFPFIGGKYFFFRFMVELGLIFLLLWWAFEAAPGELEEKLNGLFRKPLFIAVSCFVLAILLSTIFADNPAGSFWSNYERGEGGFQMVHYYLFFILLSVLLDRYEDWRRMLRLSMAAAGCMILYGLLAASFVSGFIGPYVVGAPESKNLFTIIFSSNRFQGSLGNPAYVAPYLLFIIFYVLWDWVLGPKIRSWHARYGALTAFFFLFFVLSQTRGAFLGLVAGAFAFLGYLVFFSSKRFRKAAAIALVGLVAVGGLVYANLSGVSELDRFPGGRLLTIDFSASSAQTRIWTWQSAIGGFLERPVFGWGLENFSTVFDKHFNTQHFVPGQNTETWFDRAHSVIFDYLAMTGTVGTASYLAIFVVFYYLFFRARRSLQAEGGQAALGPWAQSNIAWALLFAMPIAYLGQAAVLFDVLPIYLNLFLFLGFASFLLSPEQAAGAGGLRITETVVIAESVVIEKQVTALPSQPTSRGPAPQAKKHGHGK